MKCGCYVDGWNRNRNLLLDLPGLSVRGDVSWDCNEAVVRKDICLEHCSHCQKSAAGIRCLDHTSSVMLRCH